MASNATRKLVLLFFALFLLVSSSTAEAAQPPYQLNPLLSLRGSCGTSNLDPIADPSCPYPPPPAGPQAFERPQVATTDTYGNLYVANAGNFDTGDERIDVFDDEGRFLTELAVESQVYDLAVDSQGYLYVYVNSGKVQRYAPTQYDPESGLVEYGAAPVLVTKAPIVAAIGIDLSNDHLLVVDGVDAVVTQFGSAEENNPAIDNFDVGLPWNSSLSVDSAGRRIFVSFCKSQNEECAIRVFDADMPYTELAEMDGANTPDGAFFAYSGELGIGVDEESGEIFIYDPQIKAFHRFSADYSYLSTTENSAFAAGPMVVAVSNGTNASGDAFNRHVFFIPTFGNNRVLAFEPPGVLAPEVAISVTGVSEGEARFSAKVTPNGGDAAYVIEYTTQSAFEAEGFTGARVAKGGTVSGETAAAEISAPVFDLTPGTAYKFRIVAENEAGGAESQGSFTTYDDATSAGACPNQDVRSGPSGSLPDCRSFELVTPPETNGRSPKGVNSVEFPTVEVSPAGNTLSFRIEGGSLPGTTGVGTLQGDPYLARRSASGWSSELAGPTGAETTLLEPGAISLDQGYSFWAGRGEGSLIVPGPVNNDLVKTRYLRYPDGDSELIGRGSLGTDPRAVGKYIAPGGSHVVFQTTNSAGIWKALPLEPGAPAEGVVAIYDRTIDPVTGAEQTHLVSLLPGDLTPNAPARFLGASQDGRGIAFAIGDSPDENGDILYLRRDNSVTFEIGTIGPAFAFAGVSEGGRRIFYLQGGDLKAFDATTEEVVPFSDTHDVTPVNVAADGTRAYFVSPSVLGGTNSVGVTAQAGEQNLYLSEEGQLVFIATVTDRDVEGTETSDKVRYDGLGLWTQVVHRSPVRDPSRLNPDGSVALFQSRADLTGGNPGGAPQIYRYDSVADRLHCISCPPPGIPALAGAALQSFSRGEFDLTPLSVSSFVPGITPDGRRVFFESSEPIVSRDTDGASDVYQWEEEGVGSCRRPGGCVYLISSGRSAADNFLYGHSADGSDVFFASTDRLTRDDPGATPSIYDARVNGGFSFPSPPGECLGEACQPAVVPPGDPIPVLNGRGNPAPNTKGRCPRGKKQKTTKGGGKRCVKTKKNGKTGKRRQPRRRAGR